MKVLYSQLCKYLPDLKASAKEVADTFTLTGFMLDKFNEVEYMGKKDYFLDLEVRQNRGDSLGVLGLARELSAYYKIPVVPNVYKKYSSDLSYKLPITIRNSEAVKRIMAVKIANIKVGDSPSWLKDYLSLYEINSVNNLVDLTNFVMLETGHASHVFDVDKVGESLVWELNNGQYKNMTTLNGQELELGSDTLIISDGKRPLSLSFIGGQEDAVSNSTQNILLEMAVYNPTIVRRNARELKVITEASTRLEKFMDPDSIPEAFEWLISLITDNCGGSISSEIFDEYIQVTEKPEIKVDLNKVQEMAGISITPEESLEYLKNLGFIVIKKEGDIVFVNRPINRLDIEIEYDVFEEIIRMKGFNNIPSNHFTTQVVKDITPKRIKLMDRLSEILVNNGFDEVRSWILVDEKSNQNFNNSPWEPIKVSNSINEEVPFLRASIGVSLSGQIHNYRKNGVDPINLFEVGKTFGKKDGKYTEVNTLGVAIGNDDVNFLKNIIEITLR